MDFDRRGVVFGGAAALTASIAKAADIDARVRTGTIADVEHIVVLTQENRSFDHYFGTLNGVRGFADRFPVPVAGGGVVWDQVHKDEAAPLSPFPLNTAETYPLMRMEGTPHNWIDAQTAWDEGRMSRWPASKTERSLGYYARDDIPFQHALADAFTICDAYHASFQGGTNTNRLFIWTGTNDPRGVAGGPSISNTHDSLVAQGGHPDPYRWTTYPERLQAAGVTWRVYQDMADNFSDNPLAGFHAFRDSHAGAAGSDPELAERGLSTRSLDGLRADVVAGTLPQVSWVVAPAADSEHPGPSSPAQGADYTARVLDALTANPAVWAKTVLLVNYDENDGFFDHAPPPAPPSIFDGETFGGSTVDTAGEYHQVQAASEAKAERDDLMGRPYGLGPRVPMLVISPWSRGGWVNSEVFDHTSVIRFMERRFGVMELNISPWRRAVCGDLTSAFDFKTPNAARLRPLPPTADGAARAAGFKGHTTPATLTGPALTQAAGPRLSRALPYDLAVDEDWEDGDLKLTFLNRGRSGAVFHVYDRAALDRAPRRYTVEAGQNLDGRWSHGDPDLWILGPNGFHRRIVGAQTLVVNVATRSDFVKLSMINVGTEPTMVRVASQAYPTLHHARDVVLAAGGRTSLEWALHATRGWYDLVVRSEADPRYLRRFAGRVETGRPLISDPAMAGLATRVA